MRRGSKGGFREERMLNLELVFQVNKRKGYSGLHTARRCETACGLLHGRAMKNRVQWAGQEPRVWCLSFGLPGEGD